MIRLIRIRLLPILFLAVVNPHAPSATIAESGAQTINSIEIERAAVAEMRAEKIPGAAIAIIKDGRVIFEKGLGVSNIETSSAVTTQTLFQIGSLTKTFTAMAMLMLVEEGKASLDTAVGNYVSEIDSKLARLTLHQLLSHTSGTIDEPDEYGLHDDSALGNYIRSWKERYSYLEPGKFFSYSNSGFALAGLAVEEIAKKPFADVLKERIFTPLGMNSTTFRPTVAMSYPLAVGHNSRGVSNPHVVRPFADDSRLWPAGGMYSSLADLSRFAIAFMNDGSIDGKQALPQPVLKSIRTRMSTPYIGIPGLPDAQKYGYGMFIFNRFGIPVVEHTGNMPGFSCLLRMAPNHRFAVVVLMNETTGQMQRTVDEAMKSILRVETRSESGGRPSIPLNEIQKARYAGVYSCPNRFDVELLLKDGRLVLKRFGTELEITPLTEGYFRVRPPNAPEPQEFFIALDESGNPRYLQMFVWVFKKIR